MPNQSSYLSLFIIIILLACSTPKNPRETTTHFPTKEWTASTFETEDLDRTKVDSLHLKIKDGVYGNIDKLLIIKNGKVVWNEVYKNDYNEISKGKIGALGCGIDMCEDSSQLHEFNYYHPHWHPYYQGRKVHTLQSVTKSVAATVIGIAIQKGAIKGVGELLLPYFEEYNLEQVDERLKKATLEHLLTMQLGIEWHEMDRPLDSTNTTMQLEESADWIQFTLDQPMDAEPGAKWVYNSGASHLMSGIIKKATGKYIDEYANEFLFQPLGIKDFHWKKTPKGFPDTEGGLYLEAEDLAKIGYLYLQDGKWEGEQILPASWVKEATKKHAEDLFSTGLKDGYGYQWWRPEDETEVWAGLGFGHQFLVVIPEHQIIGVVNSWNVFDQEGVQYMFRDFVEALLGANK